MNDNILELLDGYSKKRHGERKLFRFMSADEAKSLQVGQEVWFLATNITARKCRLNGRPRLKKSAPNFVEIPLKYGLYNYLTDQSSFKSNLDGTGRWEMRFLLVPVARPTTQEETTQNVATKE